GGLGDRDNQYIRAKGHKFARQFWKEIGMPTEGHVGVTVFDSDVLSFDIAEIPKALLERLQESSRWGWGTEKADEADFSARLRVGGARGGRQCAGARHEGAAVHSMT